MPCEFLLSNLHLVAVVRNDGELVGEVLGVKGVPDVGADKRRVGAVWLVDRLEKQPALEEAFGIRRLGGRCGRREVWRDAARKIFGCSGGSRTASRGGEDLKRQYSQDAHSQHHNFTERIHSRPFAGFLILVLQTLQRSNVSDFMPKCPACLMPGESWTFRHEIAYIGS